MTSRPIIFSGAMVRAILAGRKTQTRRVIKPQPVTGCQIAGALFGKCPYGQPGDELWVREGLYRPDGDPWCYRADNQAVLVERSAETAMLAWAHHKDQDYCPSIHMPRWASRISLTVTDVRVQRVQDITFEDCEAEGIPMPMKKLEVDAFDLQRRPFIDLWDTINLKRGFGWDVNPWVWAITFEVKP